jgi:hypothetical protein
MSREKATLPAGDARKVALFGRKIVMPASGASSPQAARGTRRTLLSQSLLSTQLVPAVNCSASVEPARAVVEEFPSAITWVTISK